MIPLATTVPNEITFDTSALVFIGAGFFLAIVIPFLMRQRKKESAPHAGPVRDQWETFKEREKTSKQADRVLVELVETSREISARMDTKIRILNTLIRDAERCIARLEELRGLPPSARQRTATDAHPGPPATAEDSTKTSPPDTEASGPGPARDATGAADRHEAAPPPPGSSLADSPKRPARNQQSIPPEAPAPGPEAETGHRPPRPGPAAAQAAQTSPEAAGGLDPTASAALAHVLGTEAESPPSRQTPPSASEVGTDVAQQVLQLLKQGTDVPAVARELGLSRQEVVLIQRLHQQRGTS